MDDGRRRQHRLRRAPRGGRRDRRRAQQRARVLLPRHDAQRALRADRQPVRARPLGRRQLRRRRERARARRRRARARLRRRRLGPHPRVVLRHGRAQADLRPRPARARRRRLAAADALRPAHAHASPTAAARSPSWPAPIRSIRSACRRSARTTRPRRASPAISRACASPPPTTSATSVSTARCASASPRPSRRSPRRRARRSSGPIRASTRRSTPGTRSRAATTAPARGRCSRRGLVGDDARALIEAGNGLSAEEYVAARNAAHEIAGAWAAFHRRYDLLLTPTMECVAFPLADWAPRELDGQPIGEFYDDYCHFCYPFNLTGPARHQRADGAGLGRPAARAADRRPPLRGRPRAARRGRLGARAAVGDRRRSRRRRARPAPAELAAAAAAGERVATDRRHGGLVARRPGARRRAVRARRRPAACARCAPGARGRASWRSPSSSSHERGSRRRAPGAARGAPPPPGAPAPRDRRRAAASPSPGSASGPRPRSPPGSDEAPRRPTRPRRSTTTDVRHDDGNRAHDRDRAADDDHDGARPEQARHDRLGRRHGARLEVRHAARRRAGRSMAPVVGPLRAADLAFANLEETLSQLPDTKCGGSPNCFAFQAPPSHARSS